MKFLPQWAGWRRTLAVLQVFALAVPIGATVQLYLRDTQRVSEFREASRRLDAAAAASEQRITTEVNKALAQLRSGDVSKRVQNLAICLSDLVKKFDGHTHPASAFDFNGFLSVTIEEPRSGIRSLFCP